MIKEGVFSQVTEVFDPNEVLNLICEVFAPQTDAKRIKLFWNMERGLTLAKNEDEYA